MARREAFVAGVGLLLGGCSSTHTSSVDAASGLAAPVSDAGSARRSFEGLDGGGDVRVGDMPSATSDAAVAGDNGGDLDASRVPVVGDAAAQQPTPVRGASIDAGSTPELDADDDAGSVWGEVSGSHECGGYVYPETTIVHGITCDGAYSACVGSAEFVVVGCYRSPPAGNPCPAGFVVATGMVIGQWAEAADITRYYSGSSVCAWTHGSGARSAFCGHDDVSYAYCWPRGARCPDLGRFTAACPEVGPCTVDGYLNPPVDYAAPALCVRRL